MAKPKKTQQQLQQKKPRKDPRVESEHEEVIEFMCPVRGKVKQKVKVTRFKPLSEHAQKHVISTSDSIDRLEEKDDGLAIYSDGEELGITTTGGDE